MSSGFPSQRNRRLVGRRGSSTAVAIGLFVMGVLGLSVAMPLPRRPAAPLRVCADPNNLPFSNNKREGLENHLADLVARELRTTVTYIWWAQRRGFIRNTLNSGDCDVVMGVPSSLSSVATTKPYYRSRYVFVTRADRNIRVRSFDDPKLRRFKIGVQVVGDGANTPPMEALARRGLARNLVGYTVFGDYAQPNPPARIVTAVAAGEVDIAVVWGPLAGFFARHSSPALELTPVPVESQLPFEFSISMAVRKDSESLRATLDSILDRCRPEIQRILDDYGVPRVPVTEVRS
ncbi:MAG TPA: substrate-binding domain-containing protein [Gemmatimonadales bacterium]|nr:substrate-binding domain-containing protein [Gemmatimonadales bacterium]